jgi:cell division protein FtsL
MIISRKGIFHKVLLISLTVVVLVYGVTFSINSEKANTYCKEINIDKHVEGINTLIIPENNHQICDSLAGICSPPPGWNITNN